VDEALLQDIPIGLLHDIHDLVSKFSERVDEVEDLVTGNRIFKERAQGMGCVSAEEALNRGFSYEYNDKKSLNTIGILQRSDAQSFGDKMGPAENSTVRSVRRTGFRRSCRYSRRCLRQVS
jgi:hypothetical protein